MSESISINEVVTRADKELLNACYIKMFHKPLETTDIKKEYTEMYHISEEETLSFFLIISDAIVVGYVATITAETEDEVSREIILPDLFPNYRWLISEVLKKVIKQFKNNVLTINFIGMSNVLTDKTLSAINDLGMKVYSNVYSDKTNLRTLVFGK